MERKSNFIISYTKDLWDKDSKEKFIADPYVYHVLERNNEIKEDEVIVVVDYLRKEKKDLINDSDFVDLKYEKYINILSIRLNRIHNKNYKSMYWKKSFSMSFIRYITAFYNTYKICEEYFNIENHKCNILSVDSYFTPFDFEEHRKCFQNTDFGQEQIFSIYINHFYPKKFKSKKVYYSGNKGFEFNWIEKFKNSKTYSKIKDIYYGVKYQTAGKKSEIGILGSYFSANYYTDLSKKSKYRIGLLNFPKSYYIKKKKNQVEKRKYLAKFDEDFDRFDEFFFASMEYCIPSVFVENYYEIEFKLNNQIESYPNLKFIIGENWISNTYNSIAISLMQQKGIKHINNEHNCFFHPFAGSFIHHVVEMSDIFTTIGWSNKAYSNLVATASLFPFTIKKNKSKKNKILFVAGALGARSAHYSGAYGFSEENAQKSVKFNISFFGNLTEATLGEITYRGYPHNKIGHIQLYYKEHYYKELLYKFAPANYKKSGKQQMSESHLVIVDYVSTAHIESILMNIPTIFFWDQNAYYLNEKYIDFFQPLINTGICQTDPLKASNFVEEIKDNIDEWWFGKEVQKGRHEFLKVNMGDPEKMINYILSLLEN